MKLKNIAGIIGLILSQSIFADTYEVIYANSLDFEDTETGVAYITNLDSLRGTSINMESIQRDSDRFSALDDGNGITYAGGVDAPTEYMQISDIRDNIVHMSRLQSAVQVGEMDFGRVMEYNMETNEVISDKLIAFDDESYNYAVSKGYTVLRSNSTNVGIGSTPYTFTSYSSNALVTSGAIQTDGGLYTQKIMDSDGISLFRKDADGTVHIGQNSILMRDSTISNNGNDQIWSSVNRLQLGNSPSHRTIVQGTLEIQDPTEQGHASTKRYVDYSTALAMAMAAIPRSYSGKTMIGFGTGYHGGESAVALGLSKHVPENNIHINASFGYTHMTKTSASAGIGYEF